MKAVDKKNTILQAGSGSTPGRFWLLPIILFIMTSCATDKELSPSTNDYTYLQNTNPKEFYELTLKNSKIYPTTTDSFGAIWGVTVPHHLLAADLTAAALKDVSLKMAKNGSHPAYEKIFIISPDHYSHGKSVITIANQNLKTSMGESPDNPEITGQMSKLKNVKINNKIFSVEHGISAIIPFVQTLWPQAKTIPILVRADATAQDLAGLLAFLQEQIASPGTLIIQSSDFSHYLTADQAKPRDLQTISTIQLTDPQKMWTLNQPANCDSVNILYLMKSIQQNTGSKIKILDNKNSQDYTKENVRETTSYITILFSK